LPLFYLYGLFLSVETTINIGLSLLRFWFRIFRK
jgi:hypothetical protein